MKLKTIGKILLIIAVLIAVGYLASLIDSETIFKKPWFEGSKIATLDICENCKNEFEDLRINVGNLQEDDYFDVNGEKQHGNVAELALSVRGKSFKDKTIAVYEGQSFTIDKYNVFAEKIILGVKADPGLIGAAMGGIKLKITKSTSNSDIGGTVISIRGDTQGSYGDLRIGVESSPKQSQYVVGGIQKTGVVAKLWISVRDKSDENKVMIMHIGQTFNIDKYKITVHNIISGDPGIVSLRIQEIKK